MIQEAIELSSIESNDDGFVVSGFWVPWKPSLNPGQANNTTPSYYESDVKYFDEVVYSFMMLDQHPNAGTPRNTVWNGTCLYDGMTADCA